MEEMKVRKESMEEGIKEWANYKFELENKEKWDIVFNELLEIEDVELFEIPETELFETENIKDGGKENGINRKQRNDNK